MSTTVEELLLKEVPRASVERGRWEFLDVIRGVAAVLVVLHHGLGKWAASWQEASERYVDFGEIGVVAFFLVSGFIIPMSIERHHSLQKFWVGRFFRLMPLYLSSFAVVLFLHHFGWFELPAYAMTHWVRFVAENASMLGDALHPPPALSVYWTLTYELIFYVLCSVLFFSKVLRLSRLWAWVAVGFYLGASLAVAGLFHHSLSGNKIGILVSAFIGTLLFRYSARGAKRAQVVQVLGAMAITVPIVAYLRFVRFPKETDVLHRTLFSVCASWFLGYLLFGVFFWMRKRQFPAVLMWMGRISYSIYLVHPLVFLLLPVGLSVWVGLPAALVLTLGISQVTYRLIEQPPLALQKRLTRRLVVTTPLV